MGIDHFGEMHRLADIARPNVCVITNIGYAHLENLGSRKGILQAKTEMFDHLQPEFAVVLNGDDDMLRTVMCTDKNRSSLASIPPPRSLPPTSKTEG